VIRTTAAPRPLRAAAAAASVVGIVALAGCAATATPTPTADSGDTGGDAGSSGTYTDGTYTADGSYATPESVETITVTLTLESGVVTDVEVTGEPTRRESEQYQGQFIGGISDEVVGKNIDDLSVSRVAGSSLTSGGFNEALDAIKAEAAA
jgi:uncharacterized protein with FMN-binding domain